ncbi:MAG: helix-turn-helix transcriptional regulator [Thermoanaerobaculia bacterium]
MTPPSAPVPTLDIQNLSRSCNQILILSTLASGPRHGYQLALELEENSGGAFRFQHGTLYPILHKLENEGLIRGDWLEEQSRRRRKSYRLTAAGQKYLKEQSAGWREFFDRFFSLIGEVEK